LAGICSFVTLCGCGIFDPKEKDRGGGGTQVTYPPLASPALAVLNVKMAWDARDSTRISQIYANDYQGSSTDLATPGSGELIIAKSEEVSAVGGLRKDPDVSNVSVTFQDSTTWVQEWHLGDPPDRISVIVRNPVIYISTNGGLNDQIVSDSKTFTFKVDPVSDGSGGVFWQIVRWIEVHDPPNSGP
jgi:hypothetical protein